jgi:hypothetical protein
MLRLARLTTRPLAATCIKCVISFEFSGRLSICYARHDNALAHGALSHVFAMHVALIRRHEFIKRGVPFRARIRLVDKDEIAVLA